VTLAFYLIAAAMLAAALALLLVPLVRHGRRQGRPRGPFVIAVVVAIALPAASVGIYALVGNPQTLAGVEPAKELTVDQAIAGLRDQVKAHPDDVTAWVMLGQAYAMLKRPADARDAFDGALKADAKNATANCSNPRWPSIHRTSAPCGCWASATSSRSASRRRLLHGKSCNRCWTLTRTWHVPSQNRSNWRTSAQLPHHTDHLRDLNRMMPHRFLRG